MVLKATADLGGWLLIQLATEARALQQLNNLCMATPFSITYGCMSLHGSITGHGTKLAS